MWPNSYQFDQKQILQGQIWMVVLFCFVLKRPRSICNILNASFSFSEEQVVAQKKKTSLHCVTVWNKTSN